MINPSSTFTAQLAQPTSQTVTPPSSGNTSASYTVNLTSLNNFAGTITFAASGPNVSGISLYPISPVALSAGGNGTASVTALVAPGTPPGAYPITFTATGSSGSQTLTANLNVQQGPAFTLSAGSPQTIQQGQPATFTISLNPAAGFTGAVNLNVGPITGGVTASLSSTSVSAGAPVTLTLTAANNATLGAYSILVNGASANGALTGHAVAPLIVNLGSNAGSTITLGNIGLESGGQATIVFSPLPPNETLSSSACATTDGSTVSIGAVPGTATQTVNITPHPGTSGTLTCTTSSGRTVTAQDLDNSDPGATSVLVSPNYEPRKPPRHSQPLLDNHGRPTVSQQLQLRRTHLHTGNILPANYRAPVSGGDHVHRVCTSNQPWLRKSRLGPNYPPITLPSAGAVFQSVVILDTKNTNPPWLVNIDGSPFTYSFSEENEHRGIEVPPSTLAGVCGRALRCSRNIPDSIPD